MTDSTTKPCARCGGPADFQETISFSWNRRRWICTSCFDRREERAVVRYLVLIAVAGIVVVLWRLWAGELPEGLGVFLQQMSIVPKWYLCAVLMLVLHEASHAVTALLMGMRVQGVTVGRGRRLFRLQMRRFFIDWHLVPIMGLCWAQLKTERGWRWRWALMVAAGPAFHLVMAIAAFGWYRSTIPEYLGGPRSIIHSTSGLLLLVNGLMFVENVIPHSVTWGGMKLRSDGGTLLDLLRQRGRPDLSTASLVEVIALAEAGKWEQAQQTGREFIAKDVADDPVQHAIAAWVAVADVWVGGQEDLREAEQLSQRGLEFILRQAAESAATVAAFKCVRACVLLAHCQDDAAAKLLDEAHAGAQETSKKAAAHMWMEIYRRRGDSAREAEWSKVAAELDPEHTFDMRLDRYATGLSPRES